MNECGIITIGQPDGLVTIGQPICGAVPREPIDDLREILEDVLLRVTGEEKHISEVVVTVTDNQAQLACWCGEEGEDNYVFCTPKKGYWYGYIHPDGMPFMGKWRLVGTTTIQPDFITSDELFAANGYTLVFTTDEELAAIVEELANDDLPNLTYRNLYGETSGYTLYDYIRSEGNSKLQLEQVYTLGGGFEVDLEPDGYEYSRAFGDMASDACCYINEFSDVTFWLECPTQPNKIQMQMWTGRSVVRVEGHYDKFLTFLDGEQKAQRNPLDINWRFCLFGNNKGYYKGRIYAVRIFSLWESGNYFDEWLPCTNANGVAGLICMQQGGNFLTTGGLSCGNL